MWSRCGVAVEAVSHPAIGNDVFTDAIPPADDDGFTNDIDVRFWRPRGRYLVGAWVLDRWVTQIGGKRRWDMVEAVGTLQRSWGQHLIGALRVGPVFGGTLGGRWGQNAFHGVCHCGRLLSEGTLQDTYVGGRSAGAMAGVRVMATAGEGVQPYAVADAQGAVGAGVSSIEGAGGVRVATRLRCVRLAAHGEIAGTRYHVNDPQLGMNGGYGAGWQMEWRVGAEVAWSRYHVDYEYRANEGGSGQPFAVVAFTVEYRP